MTGLAVLTGVLTVLSLLVGHAALPLVRTLGELVRGETTMATLIVAEIRLPRTLLAAVVGASLGMAGAAVQGLLRNPLAEPGILGVSGCAALGAVLTFYTGLSATVLLALPLGGIVGAGVAVAVLYGIAGRYTGTLTLILAGVAVNSFAGALTSLTLNLAPNPYASREIMVWLMGSIADRSFDHVALVLPFALAGWVLLLASGPRLDALTLGEETAQSLGVRLGQLRLFVVAGTALAVGGAVAVSGVIGFVGLVVPHILRPFVGYQPRLLLPASALGGAALTLSADIFVRTMAGGPEIKLGVVTALLGAPFFLALIHRMRRELA